MDIAEIKRIINSIVNIEKRKDMLEGEKYYLADNDINKRERYVYTEDGMVKDTTRANNKLGGSYLKLLIDQKINYSINNKLQFELNDENIENYIKNFGNKLKNLGKEASKKSFGVWQVYVKNGKLKLFKIPSEQIFYTKNKDEIDIVTRVYKSEGKKVFEYYRDNEYKIMIGLTANDVDILNDDFEIINNDYHYKQLITNNGQIEKETKKNFGRPPFIILENNEELTNDLNNIKSYIDAMDVDFSDFANNLEDFQDSIWVLKNFDGQDLNEFHEQVKKYKSIKVSEDGDAKRESHEIAHEAREKFVNMCEKYIYKFGQGVNPDDIEGNITNVRIKAMFANLDLKANDFESNIQEAIEQLIYFMETFYNKKFDYNLEFSRALMLNEVELSKLANESKGLISEETRLGNDPRVTNVSEEIERIEKLEDPYEIENNG